MSSRFATSFLSFSDRARMPLAPSAKKEPLMVDRHDAVSRLLEEFGEAAACRVVGGGCISEAMQVSLSRSGQPPRFLFVKRNRADFIENFRREEEGLQQLGALDAIRVPVPLKCTVVSGHAWLVTEWIEQNAQAKRSAESEDFFARFGRQLASLHEKSRGDAIGLDHDNFLGSARQINTPSESWTTFFQEHRLGFQLRWAVDQGLADRQLRKQSEQLIERLPQFLQGRAEETSLLHGDLWSGNYLQDAAGQPVILDPAIYRGCREAEFGMLRLFGGCPSRFYDAYQEAWPMPDGWQRRVRIYVLYHLWNHLNLFGSGYAAQCRALTAEILRET